MSEAVPSDLPHSTDSVSAAAPQSAVDETYLRDALKRCSPGTSDAAWAFRKTGDVRHIPAIVGGVIERYMDRDQRQKLGGVSDDLRLSEDLGIDSLTMMEIVLIAEDVLPITIHNEELCSLRTVGDVNRFIVGKLQVQA